MDLSPQISSLGTHMEDLVVVSDTQFYYMEDCMDQQQSAFDHLQHRIEHIKSCRESQHKEMMTYLHSVFPPLPPQPWFHRDPLHFFFMLPNVGRYLGFRRPTCISLSYLFHMFLFRVHLTLLYIYMTCYFHDLHCFLLSMSWLSW